MASFPGKIGWKRLRKRENKNYRSVPFTTEEEQKIKKKTNIIQKIKKYHSGFFSRQNRLENDERNKNYRSVPFRSYSTRNKKFKNKSNKIQKIKKKNILASFQAKIGWNRLRKRENKNYHSVSFLPDA